MMNVETKKQSDSVDNRPAYMLLYTYRRTWSRGGHGTIKRVMPVLFRRVNGQPAFHDDLEDPP